MIDEPYYSRRPRGDRCGTLSPGQFMASGCSSPAPLPSKLVSSSCSNDSYNVCVCGGVLTSDVLFEKVRHA